jgi:2-polyprenyl-3-methyl-5-hydroxy-6-metoxy-1,4-benzoquinol methylase
MPKLADVQFRERTACGLCAADQFKLQQWIGEFPILKCESCGFLQTGRLLDDATLMAYYQSGYGGLRQRQGQEVNSRVNIGLMQRAGISIQGARILDIGCGYGFLLKVLTEQHAAQTIGVEPAQAELAVARDELGLDVRGSLEAVTEADFDVVCLFEVIEHITEPLSFLKNMKRFIRPGGVLCIATDNFNSAIVTSMGARFPKWIPHQHVSLFDHNTLPALIEKAGNLEIISRMSFTPWELLAQSVALRASAGKRGGKVFSLADEVGSENSRPYPLFALRKRLNKEWVRLSANKDLSGEMMFVAARMG